MIYSRVLETTIKRAMKTFPAVLVTGPRQSGKTTLLSERFSGTHRFVFLENPDVRARVMEDPVGFLRENPPPVIFDEIQYVPELLHYIKSSIDENREPGQWLLSGSQSFPLMQGISQSLSGRVAVLTLLPFSLGESQRLTGKPEGIDETLERILATGKREGKRKGRRRRIELYDWLLRGAYPEIRADASVDRQLWCASYIQTYLERDVRQLVNVGDLNAFNRFLRLCAARVGQTLNMSDLSRDLGFSVPTVKKWLSVLEASYQIYLLPPHFNNFGKRIVRSPRLYFMDTGVATYLLGLHAKDPLLEGPMLGPLFENAVVSEWVKLFYHRGERPELYYWRSKAGLEVDLIVDRNRKLLPIESKATATLVPAHVRSLKTWRELVGSTAERGIIVADMEKRTQFGDCICLPWSEGLD